jgi:hypothetical protein
LFKIVMNAARYVPCYEKRFFHPGGNDNDDSDGRKSVGVLLLQWCCHSRQCLSPEPSLSFIHTFADVRCSHSPS